MSSTPSVRSPPTHSSEPAKPEISPPTDALTIHAFYHELLKVLSKEVATLLQQKLLPVESRLLAERCTHSLYLWAHGLDLQHFESEVPKETRLQSEVAQLLLDIARAVCSGALLGPYHTQFAHNIIAFELLYNDLDELSSYGDDNDTSISSDDQHTASTDLGTVSVQAQLQDGNQPNDHDRFLDVFKTIDQSVRDLMNMLPTIESCCNEDEIVTVPHENPAMVLQQEQILDQAVPYILQVKDKFPEIQEEFARRVGIANLDRWFRLRDLQSKNDESLDDDSAANVLPRSEFQDSGLGASLPTRSHYAASNTSHKSFMSTDSATARGAPRVPKTPKAVLEGLPFACQLCKKLQRRIRNRVDWKRHVFADIRPYLCTFADCNKSQLTFSTRRQWSFHEFDEHRRHLIWRCTKCKLEFRTETFLWNHKTREHPEIRDDDEGYRATLLKHSQIRVPCDITLENCPFCQQSNFVAQKDFVNHVSRHMEEVALIAVPDDIDSNDQDDFEDADSGPDRVSGDSEAGRKGDEPLSILTKEDNQAINTRAAELAKARSKKQMELIRAEMDPDLRTTLTSKGIDPLIYYFRMEATQEFRSLQASARKSFSEIPEGIMNTEPKKDAQSQPESIAPYSTKRLVRRITEGQTIALRNWFNIHIHSPYPSADEMQKLQEQTQLTVVQIRNWFSRARQQKRRSKRQPDSDDSQAISVTKCVCASIEDDGNMVYCEHCETWQHIKCYYKGEKVPDEHYCLDCKPPQVSASTAFNPADSAGRQNHRPEANP